MNMMILLLLFAKAVNQSSQPNCLLLDLINALRNLLIKFIVTFASLSCVVSYKYYVIFVDDFTRFVWLYPLCNNFDFYDTFLNFEQFVLRQFSATIKRLQTDGGGEFVSHKLKQHCG